MSKLDKFLIGIWIFNALFIAYIMGYMNGTERAEKLSLQTIKEMRLEQMKQHP